jgi:hypothetical protein
MVVITLKSGADWYKANWVFRQIANDVIANFPEDTELRLIMQKAQAFGALALTSMDQSIAHRTLRSIKKVAEATLDGTIPGWKGTNPTDENGQRMYIEAVSELLVILEKESGEA